MLSIPWILSTVLLVTSGAVFGLLRRERLRRANDLAQWEAARAQLEQTRSREQVRLERWIGFLQRLHDSRPVPETILDAAHRMTGATVGVLLETGADTVDLLPVASRGLAPQQVATLRVIPGQGIIGRVAASGKAVVENTAEAKAAPEAGFLTAPYVILPVRIPHRMPGVLVLAQPEESGFDAESVRLLGVLAQEAGLLLGYAGLQKELETSQGNMVASLAQAVDAKDAYTHQHSDRTRSLVRAMAADLRIPENWIRQIEFGALLHDVGKIGIADAILQKPGKLTAEEYGQMKQHPAIGQRILSPVPFLRPVASIVLYHQEWFNGDGYPEGLAGEEIPLGARIVGIIDAWDAMTSDRPYRKAMTKAAAITELRRQAGTQFDPKLVDVFLRALERLDHQGVATTA